MIHLTLLPTEEDIAIKMLEIINREWPKPTSRGAK